MADPKHVIPNGLVHVVLVGFDEAPAIELEAADARARQDDLERRLKDTYRDPNHERWFFHAFDAREMEFVIAKWEPHAPVGGRYVAVQRIRVARSPDAERALLVADVIKQYEQGEGGVRAGMTPEEVRAAKGAPNQEQQLGPFGAFDWIYPDQCVRFLQGRVAHVWEASRCVK
jgi:hypothetical protein